MKKTLLIVAAAAMSFAACNKEEIQTVHKGMTLSANVAETKATINDNGDKSWSFVWETNDKVAVIAPGGTKYAFVKPETGDFKCDEAVPEAGTWTAVFPFSAASDGTGNINFNGLDGSKEAAMNRYYLKGTCESDGASHLSFEMSPSLAILKITNATETTVKSLAYYDGKTYFAYYSPSRNYIGGYADYHNILNSHSMVNGETAYFVAPATEFRIVYTVHGTRHELNSKGVEAGHIYNVTLK